MPGMARVWIGLGSLAGCTAVIMAALAAHALPQKLPPRAVEAVRAAVQMQGWHAIALVLVGIWAMRGAPSLVNVAGAAFLVGLILFCGSVYLGELAGVRFGPTAPVGGIAFMAGWLLLAVAAWVAAG